MVLSMINLKMLRILIGMGKNIENRTGKFLNTSRMQSSKHGKTE